MPDIDFQQESQPNKIWGKYIKANHVIAGGFMKILTISIVFLISFFGVLALSAEIYSWTDENGVKHYSDHPPEDAKDVKAVSSALQNDTAAADSKQSEKQQKELQGLIKEVDEQYEKNQQEETQRATDAAKNRPPTKEEKIAAEQKRLEQKIAELEEQPLEYFGSQKNKRVRIGYYKYRLEALIQDPDKYFKNPEGFEGNVKEP